MKLIDPPVYRQLLEEEAMDRCSCPFPEDSSSGQSLAPFAVPRLYWLVCVDLANEGFSDAPRLLVATDHGLCAPAAVRTGLSHRGLRAMKPEARCQPPFWSEFLATLPFFVFASQPYIPLIAFGHALTSVGLVIFLFYTKINFAPTYLPQHLLWQFCFHSYIVSCGPGCSSFDCPAGAARRRGGLCELYPPKAPQLPSVWPPGTELQAMTNCRSTTPNSNRSPSKTSNE